MFKVKKIKGYITSHYCHFKHIYKLKTSKKIIIGSSGTFQYGWFSTDYPQIDITSIEQCKKYWKKNSKSAFFAEHVWEHLTQNESKKGAECCYYFLQKKGRVRIAVPDGNHTDSAYIDNVKPGGVGSGAEDHKILFKIDSLSEIFKETGFKVVPLEFWDDMGNFHKKEWETKWGKVLRSRDFDSRNSSQKAPSYSSIIIDCFKT
jgi:predicted SAM-dependent methyltransferase